MPLPPASRDLFHSKGLRLSSHILFAFTFLSILCRREGCVSCLTDVATITPRCPETIRIDYGYNTSRKLVAKKDHQDSCLSLHGYRSTPFIDPWGCLEVGAVLFYRCEDKIHRFPKRRKRLSPRKRIIDGHPSQVVILRC